MEAPVGEISVTKHFEADQKLLDRTLQSPDFIKSALTIEQHEKYFDERMEEYSKPYPGAVIGVHNLHMVLPIARKIYREVGAPDDIDANNAFNHEMDHAIEGLNQGAETLGVSVYMYLLKSNPTIDRPDSIELRTSVNLPSTMSGERRRLAYIAIANAPKDKKYSKGDLKIINS